MSKNIINVLNYNKTILNYSDFGIIFIGFKKDYLKVKIAKLCKDKIITKLTKWVYFVTSKWYDSFELPTKLYSPSYISFHSALYHHWIIFQLPNWISFAYKRNLEKQVWKEYIYSKRLKEEILYNTTWIISNWIYSIADKERAFLDTLYIYWEIYFDNLNWLEKSKVLEYLSIYKNKNFEERVKMYLNNKKPLWAQ